MTDKMVEVSLWIRVTDSDVLLKHAREQALTEGAANDEADAAIMIDDEASALRWLLDPGQSPPGTEILDSTSEVN